MCLSFGISKYIRELTSPTHQMMNLIISSIRLISSVYGPGMCS